MSFVITHTYMHTRTHLHCLPTQKGSLECAAAAIDVTLQSFGGALLGVQGHELLGGPKSHTQVVNALRHV
jgi:hypothetical protein